MGIGGTVKTAAGQNPEFLLQSVTHGGIVLPGEIHGNHAHTPFRIGRADETDTGDLRLMERAAKNGVFTSMVVMDE